MKDEQLPECDDQPVGSANWWKETLRTQMAVAFSALGTNTPCKLANSIIQTTERLADGLTPQCPQGAYFVTSGGEPNAIKFSLEEAVAVDDDYIDAFDDQGIHVQSYKRVSTGQYTTDF